MIEDRRKNFVIIGENVHTTRIVLRKGIHMTEVDGEEKLRFKTPDGERYMSIPEKIARSADFDEGRVKHVQVAVKAAMAGEAEAELGMAFLKQLVQRQVDAGAHFLDLNVDEISVRRKEQQEAMEWLVPIIESMTNTPLAIDSSRLETIAAGLEAADHSRPIMLNSASLERIEALDLAIEHKCRVVATAAGAEGMPQNTEERMTNASSVVDKALEKGIAIEDIFIDPLVFPISVDSTFGMHCLDAIRQLREKYGPAIHISGGLSNVSFGIPCRRLVNDAFTNLAVDAGADSGIIDPVASPLDRVFSADRDSARYKLAEELLLGNDLYCKKFLKAYRAGELKA